MKSRTKPFTSAKSAESFAKTVNGKVTTQAVTQSKNVHHVHYKSDGVYRGTKKEGGEGHDFNGYTHTYEDI